MSLSVKHTFQSAKSDGLDTTLVRPSNWNAEHTLTAAVDSLIGTDSGGATVKEISCTAAGRNLIAGANVAAQKVTLSVAEIPIGGGFDWYDDTLPPTNGSVVWAWANGQQISRTTYATLFARWGTQYGVGDGSTTFNIPDRREVVGIGKSTMGGTSARNLITQYQGTTSGLLGYLGSVVGEIKHILGIGESPVHSHGIIDPGHMHSGGYSASGAISNSNSPQNTSSSVNTGSNTTGITINKDGGVSVSIANGTPGTITWTAHGFTGNSPIQFDGTALPTGISAGTTYYVLGSSITTNTFQISATPGGAAINLSGTSTSVRAWVGHNVVQPSFVCNHIIRIA